MIVNICSPRGGEEGDGHLGLGEEILHVLGQVVNIPGHVNASSGNFL